MSTDPTDFLQGNSKYEKVKDLSKGTFGVVQLARNRNTGELVALKFIRRGDKVNKYVEREIINHRVLCHPNVVQFHEIFLTQQNLGIAMEYAGGGALFEYVAQRGGLPENEARWYFQQVVIALDYCHRMGVVNRDIKLENTLTDNSPQRRIKLCDFGYSKNEFFNSAPDSRVGTQAYMAPEVIMNSKGREYDGKASDVWSSGVMLYVMLCCQYPFESPEDKKLGPIKGLQAMIQRVMTAQFHVPPHVTISPGCRDLLVRMLVPNAVQRITIPELYQHPWFLENLPREWLTLNDELMQNPPPLPHQVTQSVDQIVEVIEAGRQPGPLRMEQPKRVQPPEMHMQAVHDSFDSGNDKFLIDEMEAQGNSSGNFAH